MAKGKGANLVSIVSKGVAGFLFLLALTFFVKAGYCIRRLNLRGEIPRVVSFEHLPLVNTYLLVTAVVLLFAISILALAILGRLGQKK
ncbi:hypothetical protein LR007_02740 [candidate division NPL-UPA2 bacterium]|nr:hypothetical protein [candidate division NPL-UPA2 bacterium]